MPQQPTSLFLRISSDSPKTPTEPDFDPNEFADFDPNEFSVAVDPTKNAPPNVVNQQPAEQPGMLRSLWDKYNAPLTTVPSELGRGLSNKIDPIGAEADRGYFKPFMAGAAEGLGDVVSGLTSPSNILPTIAGYGAAKTGLNSLVKAAKGLSGLQGVHGGEEVIRPDATLGQRAFGAAELMGGLAGLTHNYAKPKGTSKHISTEPLPESFGPDAYAGPERRVETRVPSEDAVFNEYRERLARGEDVRSPASKKLLEKKSELDTSRKEAKTLVRNGIKYEQTGINPDTGLPTYKPVKTVGLESSAEKKAQFRAVRNSEKVGGFSVPREPNSITTNASGESMASVEAINRQASMKANGKKYVVFDRSGKPRDLIGPEAVDYKARLGETYGVMNADGNFTPLDNNGGFVKRTINQKAPLPKADNNQPPNQPPPSNQPLAPSGGTPPPKKEMGKFANLLNATKTLKSSMDFSAPLRQGLPLIHKGAWWRSLDDMVKAWGSQGAYDNIMKEIIDDPSGYFKPGIDPVSNKPTPSYAEKMGLDLTDIVHKREEAMLSTMLDRYVPLVKRSNRAYTAFLNKLRSDSFKTLIDQAKKADPSLGNNDVLGKNLAKFVNNATGRGSLGSMEKAADIINGALFSPRLISANVQRLNPANYIFSANKGARLEYLKSMIAVSTAWTTMAGLAKLGGADVSLDPTSSDFGKIRFGNSRMDPSGGLQTYLVALARMTPKKVGDELGIKTGQFTAPIREGQSRPKTSQYGTGYPPKTKWDVASDFAFNKASPPARFAGELLKASGYKPFNTSDQIVRLFMPMIIEDMIELYKDDPSSIWMLGPDALGMGVQTFDNDNKDTLFGYKEPMAIK